MAGTYTELYYHLIWGTLDRQPMIREEWEPELYGYIRGKCAELHVFVHALNGTENHTHIAYSLPPTLSIAAFVHRIKGSSSRFANQALGPDAAFNWQEGYGALTFARRDLPRIVAYIQNQKQHHREGTLWDKLERMDED